MALHAEHQIGIKPEQAVAPAHFAALYRFEQEVATPRLDQLERRTYRGFRIGDQPMPDQRGAPLAQLDFGLEPVFGAGAAHRLPAARVNCRQSAV